jgi:ribosomal protein S18 acetylase RimI-like enzyme
MGIGSLAKLGISKGMSLGRELFGFLLRSDLNVAKIAEGAGITMDTLEAAPPEALSAILDRAARSGAIDPREANNINIQLAKEAQEVAPELTLKDRIVEKYPNVKLDLFGDASKGYELSRIELPKESRGQGIGTNIMDDLISEADAEGATISLTPDTSFGGSSVSRLNDFYKRFGFVDNKGKNKDFSTRNTMYRVPLKDTE